MPVKWTTTPEDAFVSLADAHAKAIYLAVRDIVEAYAPIAQAFMNDSIPWHEPGHPDISVGAVEVGGEAPSPEPNDMYAWVEGMVNRTITLYLGHDAMLKPEPTLEDELQYAPPAMDYFGPKILADVRAMLGSK